MTKSGWIIFSVLCVALLGGLVFISQQDRADVTAIDEHAVQKPSEQNGNIGDRTFGNMQSKVILIEYGDFQCPGCASAHPAIKEVTEKYKDKIGFVFRNFPLSSIHPNALAASGAAEAAGIQGKYWEMHNKLYENQSSWEKLSGQERTNYFKTTASQIGIDTEQWLKDLDGSAVQKKIAFDKALGQKAKVSGTPAFYINGKNVGEQYFDGDRIVPTKTDTAQLVWSDAAAFEKFVIKPALKDAGIAVE